MRKKLIMIVMAGVIAAMANITAMAGQWLGDEASGWRYQYEDGSHAAGWNWIDGKSYYFDESGNMLRNTTTPDGYQVEQSGAWTVDGIVQTEGTGTADYDPNYPLKGMLEQFGLNTTGTVGWDFNYGGNGNGDELRADGIYFYINKGEASLGAYAAALAGELYHSLLFGDLDPLKSIAGRELISYGQVQDELAVIKNFLNSFDWKNASELEKANRAAQLVIEARYEGGSLHDVNVYGNLIEKRGSCASFASSFHVLTRLMGMNSLYQEDGALDHVWNYIQIDGKWYQFDGTEVTLYGTSAEFNSSKLLNATINMPKYFDTNALLILGFNQ